MGSRSLGLIQALTTAPLLKGEPAPAQGCGRAALGTERHPPTPLEQEGREQENTIKYVYCGTKKKRIIAFFGFALKLLTFLF